MNDIIKEKKKKMILKFIFIITMVIVLIVVSCTIFGTIDYFRAKNGKKPIFIYKTVPVFGIEMSIFEKTYLPDKEGVTYYGVGYTVSTCDKKEEKYTFLLGDKQRESCHTRLTCSSNEKGTLVLNDDSTVSYNKNDRDNYDYTFYEGKLVQVIATLIRPIPSVKNLETLSVELKEFYENIPGCDGTIKKISDEAYETIIACYIPKMSSDDVEKYLPIRTKELLEYTRDEIIAYHHNDLTCE